MGADIVEKVSVVGDDDDGADKIIEEILQPVDGGNIQMVGGLVQQNDLRVAKQRLGQQHLDLLVSGEGSHLGIEQVTAKSQALQQLRDLGLRLPAVHLGKLSFKGGGPFSVLFAEVRLRVEGVLLLHDLVQPRIAHDNRIQHSVLIVLEVVLLEDRHTGIRRDLYRAGGRFQLPGEYLEKGGFAGANSEIARVAVARHEFKVYMVKQLIGAKAQAQIGNGNQMC